MPHGYWNKAGDFVPTDTKAEAVDAWRSERGYSTGGVYDMGGGEIIDTRNLAAPAISDPTSPATPAVDGIGGSQTYLQQLAELGITLPSQEQPGGPAYAYDFAGVQSKLEPTIPGAARSVEQIKQELSNQIGYDISREEFRLSQYNREGIDPGLASFIGSEMPPGAITQGLFGGLINLMSGMGGPTAEQYARMSELQAQGMSVEDARAQAMGESYGPVDYPSGPNWGSGGAIEAGSFYTAGSQPTVLPMNSEGDMYGPSAMASLVDQVQQGQESNTEIASRLMEQFLGGGATSATPENILLNIGDQPNAAYEEIQQMMLNYLEQSAQQFPYDTDIQAVYAALSNATSLEEFYTILNYGPNLALNPSGNIWTYGAGPLNEDAVDPDDVAASILSGGGGIFGDTTKNESIFSGGGGSGRKSVSQSWGQSPGGLYLWRIGA